MSKKINELENKESPKKIYSSEERMASAKNALEIAKKLEAKILKKFSGKNNEVK